MCFQNFCKNEEIQMSLLIYHSSMLKLQQFCKLQNIVVKKYINKLQSYLIHFLCYHLLKTSIRNCNPQNKTILSLISQTRIVKFMWEGFLWESLSMKKSISWQRITLKIEKLVPFKRLLMFLSQRDKNATKKN